MRRVWWHIAGRFCEVRAKLTDGSATLEGDIAGRFCEVRAKRAFHKYLVLKKKAEKFFARIEEGDT